ncbi:MAG: hypothetical protein JWO80_5253, partial [Bryobacterales bacterium]|nr:hypothetical protein [Bryobacterales bacterium]
QPPMGYQNTGSPKRSQKRGRLPTVAELETELGGEIDADAERNIS